MVDYSELIWPLPYTCWCVDVWPLQGTWSGSQVACQWSSCVWFWLNTPACQTPPSKEWHYVRQPEIIFTVLVFIRILWHLSFYIQESFSYSLLWLWSYGIKFVKKKNVDNNLDNLTYRVLTLYTQCLSGSPTMHIGTFLGMAFSTASRHCIGTRRGEKSVMTPPMWCSSMNLGNKFLASPGRRWNSMLRSWHSFSTSSRPAKEVTQ